jgi:signal transduction histidine kinase
MVDQQTNKIKFVSYGTTQPIPDFEATLIYRIVQELLINALKHALASKIEIGFFWQNDTLRISVEDDGVGYNPSSKKQGIGLNNIQKRINILKANIETNTAPNQGSNILMTFPLVF